MEKIRIESVNISKNKGTIKVPVEAIHLDHNGIQDDAHAGPWHRQVSLLGRESIDKMRTVLGREIVCGEFAENITTEGYPLYQMNPLDRLISGNIILEVTQIGKKCHGNNCTIFKETGDCIMPKEGIFCRVISFGKLKAGDFFDYHPKILKIKIITISDRASRGEYEDKSGPLLNQLAIDYFSAKGRKMRAELSIVPDEKNAIESLVRSSIDKEFDIIFTSGGTGIGPRDITPETIAPLIERNIPGIMEIIRVKYGMQSPNALISRGIAGVSGKTLIYTLPGSPKAVKEYTEEIFKTLEHSLKMLHGIDSH
jgi:molybdenum cofactor synthesis domain-containing protein